MLQSMGSQRVERDEPLNSSEEQNIKLPTALGSQKKKENSRKISTSVSLTMLQPLILWIAKNWKILQEMGIPDHLTCLLSNLYAGQEATVRTGQGTTDWLKIGKGVHQGCILSPCLFNSYAVYIMRSEMPVWIKQKLGSGLQGEISTTSDMQMTPPLFEKVKRS